eukprot:6210547-Pleurochrysis_carterae.AAC.1
MSTTRLGLGDFKLVTKLSRDSTTGRSWTEGRPDCFRGKTVVTSHHVCMVLVFNHSLRSTHACAHEDCAYARQSHRGHARERELVSYIVADSDSANTCNSRVVKCKTKARAVPNASSFQILAFFATIRAKGVMTAAGYRQELIIMKINTDKLFYSQAGQTRRIWAIEPYIGRIVGGRVVNIGATHERFKDVHISVHSMTHHKTSRWSRDTNASNGGARLRPSATLSHGHAQPPSGSDS